MGTTAAKKSHILVVDDEEDLRQTIGELLEENGYKVSYAEGGNEAVTLLNKEYPAFDLIVSDIKMPKGDGAAMLRAIREQNLQAPLVIMISGFSDLSQEDAISLGAKALLSKPFQAQVFTDTVKKVLENK